MTTSSDLLGRLMSVEQVSDVTKSSHQFSNQNLIINILLKLLSRPFNVPQQISMLLTIFLFQCPNLYFFHGYPNEIAANKYD
jgi:hypothetical protein